MGGAVVLTGLWAALLRENRWTFSLKDLLYGVVVLGMIAARYLDIVHYGDTPANETMTPMVRVVRYGLTLMVVSGFGWVLAHSLTL